MHTFLHVILEEACRRERARAAVQTARLLQTRNARVQIRRYPWGNVQGSRGGNTQVTDAFTLRPLLPLTPDARD